MVRFFCDMHFRYARFYNRLLNQKPFGTFLFLEYLVTIGGANIYRADIGNSLTNVEITHIGSERNASCQIEDLPEGPLYHSTVLSKIGIISCGGYNRFSSLTNKCYRLTKFGYRLTWFPYHDLKTLRSYFTLNEVNSTLVAIGGPGGYNETKGSFDHIDLISGTDWETKYLGFTIKYHCSVAINDEEIMVIGGKSSIRGREMVSKMK